MPRPTRLRLFRAPSLSVISFSFMIVSPGSLVFDDADQVADLGDHATHGRRVFERTDAVHLVEAEADQGLFLTCRATDRRTDLLNGDGALLGFGFLRHHPSPYSSAPT